MKDIVILGTGSFAELMYFYIKNYDKRRVAAFSVEKAYMQGKEFLGLPVYPLEQLPEHCQPETHEVLLAIGAKEMNRLRERFFRMCKNPTLGGGGYDIASFIHPSCLISPDAEIGEGNIFLEKVLVQPFVKIGKGNLFWDNVAITHNDIIGNFNTVSGGVGFSGFATVGNYCYIGKYAVVFDRVTISDYTLVGAGAYVKRDTKPFDVVVPARSVTLGNKKSTDFSV